MPAFEPPSSRPADSSPSDAPSTVAEPEAQEEAEPPVFPEEPSGELAGGTSRTKPPPSSTKSSAAPVATPPEQRAPAGIAPPVPSPTAPLAAPAELKVTPASSSEIAVRWAPPPGGGLDLTYELRRGDAIVFRGPATSAKEASLRPGQQYCYTVQAFDGWGRQSPPAGPVCAADDGPPSAPTQLQVSAASDTQVDIRWIGSTDDTGVAAYDVQREAVPSMLVGETRLSVRGLEPASQYCFTVTALDLVGNRSAAVGPACVKTPDLKPPTSPAPVAITVRPPDALVVAWNESKDDVGVVGYEVARDGVLVAQAGGTSLTQKGLRVGVRYCFTVRAYDAAGNKSAPGGPACGVLPDFDPPTRPGEPMAAGNSPTRVEVGWLASADNVGVTGYEVLRGGNVVSTVAGIRASESGLTPDTEYCYVVRALDAAGNRSAETDSVCAKTGKPGAPSAPAMVRAVSVSEKGVSLVWQHSETKGVVYRVYGRTKRITSRPAFVGMTKSSDFTDSGVPAGVPRCYSVAAVDAAGLESPRSLETCAAAPDGTPLVDKQAATTNASN